MRVKVSRTVGLKEIPALVEKIVAECKESLNQNASGIDVTMHDVPNMTQSFEEVIENLDLVSAKLQDAINISIGWQQVAEPAEASEKQSTGGINE